jgi:hypothetical protein
MVMVPAVALGGLAVFGVGYVLTSAVLKRRGGLTEGDIDTYAKLGGGLAVLLLVLSLFVIPRDWITPFWIALTVIGIAFGLFTFIAEQPAPGSDPRPWYRPAASRRSSPGKHNRSGDAPPATPTPPPSEEPYRTLLAKARYDQRLVDRLIEDERRHMPLANSDDLCRSILAKMERENRGLK